MSPSSTTGWVFEVLKGDVTGTFTAPEALTWTNNTYTGDSGMLVAIEDADPNWRYFIVFRTGRNRPVFGDTISGDKSDATFLTDDIIPSSAETFPEHYTDHATYLAALDTFAATLRAEVLPVPGGGTIVGLHFHEDQQYAIRDIAQVNVSPEDVGLLQVGMFVSDDTGAANMGEVVSIDVANQVIQITPIDSDGYSMPPSGAEINSMLSIRFSAGDGSFTKGDTVDLGGGFTGIFAYLDRRDGSFESMSAVGFAVFWTTTGDPIVTATITNTTDTGTMVVDNVLFNEVTPLMTALSAEIQSEAATFWRSTDDGWEAAAVERTIAFNTGTTDPSTGVPILFEVTKYPTVVTWIAEGREGNGTPEWTPTSQGGYDRIKDLDGTFITTGISIFNSGLYGYFDGKSDVLEVTGFNFGVLDTDTLLGIEVQTRARQTTTPVSITAWFEFDPVNVSPSQGRTIPITSGTGFATTINVGASTDLWGHTWTPAELNSADFGFLFDARNKDLPPGANINLDSVAVKLYLEAAVGSKLYLWAGQGGGSLGFIRVSKTTLNSGDWDDNDGEGYFTLSDWTLTSIPAGTEVRAADNGAGLLIAITASDVIVPLLPGSLLLDAERSRYQMISYNFFATEEKNAIYGVSGAGPAFWYDGTTLDFIFTGVDIDKDKPRHVAPHENRLALGFKWGEVYVSGTDPLDFDSAVELAASFGFGDKITGLMPAAGKALAVFTESQVAVLIGATTGFGEDALAGVDQQIVNHKVGAIEYTVQSIGNRPIFSSFRGIETLETMDQYSDFFTTPLTYDVSPFLLERLQTAAGLEATDKSVVNSVVIRNKNQYRLFFADGFVMTLTYVGKERSPQNTIQRYWFDGDQTEYARCYATASGVTTDGRDRAFFSIEGRPDSPTDPSPDVGDALGYVYELDRGRSFDGSAIDASFVLTHYYSVNQQGLPDASRAKRYNAMLIHGVCAGTADLHVSRSVNYEDLDDPVLPYEPAPFGAGDMPPEDTAKPKYTKARLSARGFAVSIHISHSSAVEFPHTIQMISLLDESQLRLDR